MHLDFAQYDKYGNKKLCTSILFSATNQGIKGNKIYFKCWTLNTQHTAHSTKH